VASDIHGDTAAEVGPFPGQAFISHGRLGEAMALVDAVIEAAAQGFFSKRFLDIRLQFGLAIQLMSAMIFHRIKKHGQWQLAKACVLVARNDEGVLGFSLLREAGAQQEGAALEVVLICVVQAARRRGLGEALVRAALSQAPCDQDVQLECLVQNRAINSLMDKMGARRVQRKGPSPSCVNATRTYALAGTAPKASPTSPARPL